MKETNTMTMTDFTSFGLPDKLMQALTRMQFTQPTPIQQQAIPVAMAGGDILGSAQTGTGKTGAFGIPLIAKLMENEHATALVMTPTRELAVQVAAALQQMIPVPTIKCAVLIGGEAMPRQFRQLQMKPRLIVGTPGRINDHLNRGTLKLNKTQFLVLDETDRMLDMGFGVQIDAILKYIPAQGRQTMLFSATIPAEIAKLSSRYLTNPTRISVGSTTVPAANIKQELIQTSEGEKYTNLVAQISQRTGSIIIFVKTKHGCDRLADRLTRADHPADAIHGDLKQSRRDRVIQDFRAKKHRILVATDVAARGLDIPHIEHVINYDLPQCPEDYIHRIGRTARAGAEGEAVNLLTPADNAKWRAIVRLIDPSQKALPAHKDEGKKSGGNRGGKSFGGGKRSFGDKKPWDNKSSGNRDFKPREDRHFGGRSDRAERPAQDRPVQAERSERAPVFVDRSDRPIPRQDRPQNNDRPQNARPRSDKPWENRSDRSDRSDRPARPAGERSDKPWVNKGERSEPRTARPATGRVSSKPWEKRDGNERCSASQPLNRTASASSGATATRL